VDLFSSGHSEAVLQCSFSPNSRILATGSGDSTVRIWDIDTETPIHTCEGHSNWVLCLAWSPDCKLIASGSKDCSIRLWKADTGEQFGQTMKQHSQYISSLAWEPMHTRAEPKYFASSSKDSTVKIWNALTQKVEVSLSSHTGGVTKVD
jgi:ribosome assembly protein 4